MQLMLASTCRGSRCRLGTLAEAHVIFGRQIPVAATASLQRQVSSASVHLEARPAPLNEPSTCHARGSAKGSSAATTSSVRCAPGWHQGSGSAAMAPAVTALTGTSRSFYSLPRGGARLHVSTASSAAADGQNVGRTIGRARDGSQLKTFSLSPSLKDLLGISDKEAGIIQRKGQPNNKGFGNFAGSSGNDGRGRCRVGGLDADDNVGDVPPPRSTSSCFPRFLLENLGVKPKNVKSLVLRRPVVLGWSAGAAVKISRWLRESLGMRSSEIARLLLKNPEAGTKPIESNIEPKVEWLRDNLNLRDVDNRGVTEVLLHAPQILNLSIERSLEPTLRWLQGRLRISREDAAKIARENPTLFWLSLEENVEPTLAWLRERLKIDDEGVVLSMVTRAPSILTLNTRTVLEPNLAWLRDRLGLSPREVCDMVTTDPTILYKSVVQNMELVVAWLKTNLNLDDEAARKMALSVTWLGGASLVENLELTLPWLREALGLEQEEAVALVKRAPVLLACSTTNNLDPTASFFCEEMGASKEELRAAVLSNPMVLAYSLNDRLRPRVATMGMMKIQPVFSKHYFHVVQATDSTFHKYLVKCTRR